MPSEKDGPEYTLAETIAELEGYAGGNAMFVVAVAESALHWLEASKTRDVEAWWYITRLREWLANDTPWLLDSLAAGVLQWLRRLQPPPSGGG